MAAGFAAGLQIIAKSDDNGRCNLQAGFFGDLANGSLLEAFAMFQMSPRDRPIRSMAPFTLTQQNFTLGIEQDDAHTYTWRREFQRHNDV